MSIKACKFIEEQLAIGNEKLGKDVLINAAKTAMSSKFISAEEDFFAALVVDAITSVKFSSDSGNVTYPIKSVNVLKAHGKGTKESSLLPVSLSVDNQAGIEDAV